MDKSRDDFYRFDVELSDRETFFVGKIVALWGALEHEVFTQTLLKFCPPGEENAALPKKVNNAQFSEVLKLWKTHVLDNAPEEHAEILKEQYEEINRLGEYRNALVHGMWDWQKTNPAIISTIRVHKNAVVEAHFTVDDLQSFYDRLGRLNFMIRYPGGVGDMMRARMQDGGFYISRRAASIFMDSSVADDLTPKANNTK